MKQLFEKIEAITVNAVSVLDTEDRQYCNSMFSIYIGQSQFFSSLYHHNRDQFEQYKTIPTFPNDDFSHYAKELGKIIDQLRTITDRATETFVKQTETYFKEKYHLDFTGFETELKENESPAALKTYEDVIANMINQVGADLMQSGRDKVITDFQNSFSGARKQPILKNSKIQLPNFFFPASFNDRDYLEYNDSDVNILLHSIALFLYDSISIPQFMLSIYDGWKHTLDYATTYSLNEGVSVKFYKNRRLDIGFENATVAERFSRFFQLETSIDIN